MMAKAPQVRKADMIMHSSMQEQRHLKASELLLKAFKAPTAHLYFCLLECTVKQNPHV